MSKVTNISKVHKKKKQNDAAVRQDGFVPCSPDMTICGDCDDNRKKDKCPRLKEWQGKKKS